MLVDGARHRSQYRVHAPPRPLIVDSRRRRHTPCAISAESHRTCDDRSPTRRRTWRRKQNGIQRSKENQWPPQTRSSDSPRGPTQPSRSGEAQIKHAAEHVRADAEPVDASLPRRAIASYSTYAEAERAVDRLSDQGFAVRRSAIVGRGLRSVEQVTGRMTPGRAALTGAGEGALIGLLFALLFGIFFTGPGFAELVLYSVVVGAVFAAPLGAIGQYVYSGGRRDFVSATHRGGAVRAGGPGGRRRRGDAATRGDAREALTARRPPAGRAGEGSPRRASIQTSGARWRPGRSCHEGPGTASVLARRARRTRTVTSMRSKRTHRCPRLQRLDESATARDQDRDRRRRRAHARRQRERHGVDRFHGPSGSVARPALAMGVAVLPGHE